MRPTRNEADRGEGNCLSEGFDCEVIVRWPDGTECPLEDFDFERDWAHRSDDFEIVRVSVGFLPAGKGSVACGGAGAAVAAYGKQN